MVARRQQSHLSDYISLFLRFYCLKNLSILRIPLPLLNSFFCVDSSLMR